MAVKDMGLNVSGLRSEFFSKFAPADAGAAYNRLATPIKSTKDSESYRWLGSLPMMREWGTGRVAKGLRVESYDVANLKYESTIEVDQDEIDDDQTGQIRIRIGELAARAATHKDYLIGQLLINGATSGFNSYDGVTFFNGAHVSGASGSQDNDLTGAITAKDTPTATEMKTALQQGIKAILNFKDDVGEPMALTNTGLVVVVPPGSVLEWAAREALNAGIISNTSNIMVGAAEVLPFNRLTDTDTWYLLKTDGITRPFIFQDRRPMKFAALAENSDEEFKREKYLYGVSARYRITYGYWQYAVKYVFTTG